MSSSSSNKFFFLSAFRLAYSALILDPKEKCTSRYRNSAVSAVGKLLLVIYPVCEYVVCTAKFKNKEVENLSWDIVLCCWYSWTEPKIWVFSYNIGFDPELESLWTCLTEQGWDNRPSQYGLTLSHTHTYTHSAACMTSLNISRAW